MSRIGINAVSMGTASMSSFSMAGKEEGESLVFYEKLIGDGTAYIDTGIVPTATMKIGGSLFVSNVGYSREFYLTQTLNGSGGNQLIMGYNPYSGTASFYCHTTTNPLTISIGKQAVGKKVSISLDYTATSGSVVAKIEGESSNNTKTETYSRITSNKLILYACKIVYGVNIACASRFYVYNNGSLSLDLRPCKYNGVCGMWDIVNGVFYGNANTSGEFSVEGEIEMLEYYDKLLVSNTKSAMVDLGFKVNGSIEFETKISTLLTGETYDGALFGTRDSYCSFILWANRYNSANGNTIALATNNGAKTDNNTLDVNVISLRNNLLMINNNSYALTLPNTSSLNNLCLFTFIGDANTTRHYKGYLYSLKFWLNGSLIRDLKPCKYFGEVGLFDVVNNVFHGNTLINDALSVAND